MDGVALLREIDNSIAQPRRRGISGKEMEVCRFAARPKYVVCNADESEPLSFKTV